MVTKTASDKSSVSLLLVHKYSPVALRSSEELVLSQNPYLAPYVRNETESTCKEDFGGIGHSCRFQPCNEFQLILILTN
jgi:hypothetical protein